MIINEHFLRIIILIVSHHSPMARLEEITVNSVVRGIIPTSTVTIKHAEMYGSDTLSVTFVDAQGRPDTQLLFRDQESQYEVVESTSPPNHGGI